jgi:anti-sigma factor RsiW
MTMTCREVRDALVDYLAGDLAPQEREELERHTAGCSHCADDVDASRNALHVSRAALQALNAPSADDVPDALLKAVLGMKPAEQHAPHRMIDLSRVRVQFSEVLIRV